MKKFSQFVTENTDREVFFTFGRFNPPSVGHEKLFEQLASLAKGKTYRIYASNTVDTKKNPLLHETKVKWMRRMFPKHGRAIMEDIMEDAQQICAELYRQGFNRVTLVTSHEQRIISEALLNRYNGLDLDIGFYNFKDGVKVVAVENFTEEGKMIEAAAANDLESFNRCLPESFEPVEELFNDIRKAIGLKESKNFRKHIQLRPVSDRREAYVSGSLFNIGDDVVIKETEEVGKIVHCGSNYLIVESQGKRFRKWLNAVELLESGEDWVEFSPTLHTLGISRTELPQVRGEDRQGLCDYLAKCGIESSHTEMDPKALKPTQAEYSPSKVEKAKQFTGEDRPLLVSVDGHVLDGHHQWLAHLDKGNNPVKVLRFGSPITRLVTLSNAYMKGSDGVKESFIRQSPKPIIPRVPTFEGISVSKIRTLRQ